MSGNKKLRGELSDEIFTGYRGIAMIPLVLIVSLVLNFLLFVSLYLFINHKDTTGMRFRKYYYMLNQWLKNIHNGKKALEYFEGKGPIAIYGVGEMGIRFYEELKGSLVDIKYFIDKDVISNYDGIPIIQAEKIINQVSVTEVIVTPVYHFGEIEKKLRNIGYQGKITSLEDIIMSQK